MRAPTSDECTRNVDVEIDGKRYVAAWYPQMGGYVGKCWIQLHTCVRETDAQHPEDGFNVLVWHDGEFPLADATEPRELHHCAPTQFIEFGQLVLRLQGGI